MKVVGIHTSPNHEGMSSYLLRAALRGAQRAGADTEIVYVHGYELQSCRTCNEGWGTCRTEGHCELPDRFEEIRAKIDAADAVVFCTPVYFGDVSEDAKRLLDRWRRCEVFRRPESPLKEKPAIAIAVAGSGGGCIEALRHLERYFTTLQFTLVDLVPVTLRNLPWREPGLEMAGKSLVEALAGEGSASVQA